ncbi:shikimate kinase [Oryzisolibacter propanilivorax]|uniref:Shikimate kinase n=1 Tax=Oryzisolibacter propanilivorax TaxID=1527607 RepID=A0A1G9QDZ0_9BURK|nr:shikimate kinase [Oryzisolibacter propanilivorax]SDM09248.1 shikimate kinase [Oryzisolibacter propanilivorax]
MQTRCALVGMPGSGKTTVGRQLARRLQLPFVDMDQRLEEVLGTSIRQYFEECGEAAFRDHEQALLAELAAQDGPVVLSTGGGVVLREVNRAALRTGFDTVLYLRATPEDLMRRLRHDQNRPLLQVEDPLGRLRELYRVRDPLYREVAQHCVESPRPTVHGLVSMAAMQLEMTAAARRRR